MYNQQRDKEDANFITSNFNYVTRIIRDTGTIRGTRGRSMLLNFYTLPRTQRIARNYTTTARQIHAPDIMYTDDIHMILSIEFHIVSEVPIHRKSDRYRDRKKKHTDIRSERLARGRGCICNVPYPAVGRVRGPRWLIRHEESGGKKRGIKKHTWYCRGTPSAVPPSRILPHFRPWRYAYDLIGVFFFF